MFKMTTNSRRLNISPVCSADNITWRVNFLRRGLGIIYLWFGALKFIPGFSPAEALATVTMQTVTFGHLTPDVSLPVIAAWEAAIGLGLLTGKFQRAAILLLYIHVGGTLLPLVLLPNHTWSKFLVAPSLEGQYIFKNLITVGGALVVGAMARCNRPRKEMGSDKPRLLTEKPLEAGRAIRHLVAAGK